jgi:hypothetical protein
MFLCKALEHFSLWESRVLYGKFKSIDYPNLSQDQPTHMDGDRTGSARSHEFLLHETQSFRGWELGQVSLICSDQQWLLLPCMSRRGAGGRQKQT